MELDHRHVGYVFIAADGKAHTGYDDIDLDFPAEAGRQIDIIYLKGDSGYTMVAGQGHSGYFFWGLAGLVLMGVPVVALFRGARPPPGRPGRR